MVIVIMGVIVWMKMPLAAEGVEGVEEDAASSTRSERAWERRQLVAEWVRVGKQRQLVAEG